MKTKIRISLMSMMLAFAFASCDDNRMCDDDAACYSVCAMYEKSILLVACSSEGTCICMDSEALACDAAEVVEEGEKPQCEKVCSSVKPGSEGVCKKSLCECREPNAESGDTADSDTADSDNSGNENEDGNAENEDGDEVPASP